MAYCSSEGKFATEEVCEEPEEQSLEVDEEGNVSASVRIWKECGGCSQEMGELVFDLEGQIDFDPEEPAERHHGPQHVFWEAKCSGWELTDRMQDTDRHGKKIKSYRYMKRMVGVSGEVVVECSCGTELGSVTLADEDSVSSIETESH